MRMFHDAAVLGSAASSGPKFSSMDLERIEGIESESEGEVGGISVG